MVWESPDGERYTVRTGLAMWPSQKYLKVVKTNLQRDIKYFPYISDFLINHVSEGPGN